MSDNKSNLEQIPENNLEKNTQSSVKSNFDYKEKGPLDLVKSNPKTFIISAIVIISVVAFGFGLNYLVNGAGKKPASSIYEIIRAENPQIGKKDSRIQVLLVEDIQCGGCQSFSRGGSNGDGFMDVKKKYLNDVSFIYKFVRIIPGHTYAADATKIIHAVEKQNGKGVDFADSIYKDVADVSQLGLGDMTKAVASMGLDMQKTNQIAASEEISKIFDQDMADLQTTIPAIEGYTKKDMLVSSTPTVMIFFDGELKRFTVGQDSSNLVDPATALSTDPKSIADYLDKLIAETK